MTTIRVLFHGKVQGVGFRETIRRYALHYGVKGYVSNQTDGSVVLVAQSDQEVLDRLIASIKERPRGAKITECLLFPYGDEEIFTNFFVRHV